MGHVMNNMEFHITPICILFLTNKKWYVVRAAIVAKALLRIKNIESSTLLDSQLN